MNLPLTRKYYDVYKGFTKSYSQISDILQRGLYTSILSASGALLGSVQRIVTSFIVTML